MTGEMIKKIGDYLMRWLNLSLIKLGLVNGYLNLISALLGLGSGFYFSQASPAIGLVLLLIHGLLDYCDGGTTRIGTKKKPYFSRAHLVADKVAEVAIFTGIALGGLTRPGLAMLALLSSVGTSIYGQYLISSGKLTNLEGSFFDRADRVIILVIMGIFNQFGWAGVIISLINIINLIQRVGSHIGYNQTLRQARIKSLN